MKTKFSLVQRQFHIGSRTYFRFFLSSPANSECKVFIDPKKISNRLSNFFPSLSLRKKTERKGVTIILYSPHPFPDLTESFSTLIVIVCIVSFASNQYARLSSSCILLPCLHSPVDIWWDVSSCWYCFINIRYFHRFWELLFSICLWKYCYSTSAVVIVKYLLRLTTLHGSAYSASRDFCQS